MKLFRMIRVWKVRKQARRVEFEKQEQLIAQYARHIDSHGFRARTRWPS